MPEHAEDEVAGQPQVSTYRLAWATSSVHSVLNQRGPALGLRPGTPRQATASGGCRRHIASTSPSRSGPALSRCMSDRSLEDAERLSRAAGTE